MGDLERLDDELRSVLFRIMTWQNIHGNFNHNDESDDLPEA